MLYDFGRQPRASHDFFVKYQDRILFGKDSYQPDEYPYYWRVFETNDEYFDYYRDYHAFWKLYGIGLPDQVLKKLYYQNALKLVPGLPHAGVSRTSLLLARYCSDDSWPPTSSPAAPGSSGRTSRKSWSDAAHRVRVADNLITGKRRNLDHMPGVEFLEGDLADSVVRRAGRGRDGLRAAPGGHPVGAAVGEGSRSPRTAPTSTPR